MHIPPDPSLTPENVARVVKCVPVHRRKELWSKLFEFHINYVRLGESMLVEL